MFNNFFQFFKDTIHYANAKCSDVRRRSNRLLSIFLNNLLFQIRWKFTHKPLNEFKNYNYSKDYGILFISNHTSNMDGNLIYWPLAHLGYFLNIWAHDFVFNLPYLGWAISSIGHIKVPNVSARRDPHDKKAVHKALVRTVDGLKRGEHFLLFPAGSSKKLPREVIGGKSAVHNLLHQIPDVNIVLIRHQGMWGSRFSWAAKRNPRWKSESHRWIAIIVDACKMAIFNLLFFVPKREFCIELKPAPSDFPRRGTRKEINQWLEAYFNEGIPAEGEPVNAVNDYFWREDHIEYQCIVKRYLFDPSQIPEEIRREILQLTAAKANMPESKVQDHFALGNEIGLDSLEITDLLMEVEKRYDLPVLVPGRVTTVGHLMAIAAKIPIQPVLQEIPLKVIKQGESSEGLSHIFQAP